MNYLKGILSLFAVKSPQAVKKALQKVTNFTQFLEFCKCQFGKSKEAERFSIVEKATMYNTASLTLVFLHGHQSTEQYFIYCILKTLNKPIKPTLQSRRCTYIDNFPS